MTLRHHLDQVLDDPLQLLLREGSGPRSLSLFGVSQRLVQRLLFAQLAAEQRANRGRVAVVIEHVVEVGQVVVVERLDLAHRPQLLVPLEVLVNRLGDELVSRGRIVRVNDHPE